MLTQPQLVVYTTTTRTIRPQFVWGTEFRFVHCKPENMCGMTDHWIAKTRTVRISNRERTAIDRLRQSEYCGGFSEAAKGFRMQRGKIDVQKLMLYAYRLVFKGGTEIKKCYVATVACPHHFPRITKEYVHGQNRA